jgi:hypothetical protein
LFILSFFNPVIAVFHPFAFALFLLLSISIFAWPLLFPYVLIVPLSLLSPSCLFLILYLDFASNRGWGPRGERIRIIQKAPLGTRIHVTLITSLTARGRPFHLDVREGTNTGTDFARVIRWAVAQGYLVAGDYLVCDGARVHFSSDIRDDLLDFLEEHGVLLPISSYLLQFCVLPLLQVQAIILPAYSPELNPCELVFQVSKATLSREGALPEGLTWVQKIVASFLSIPHEEMLRMYETSIVYGGDRRRK